jgi:hypothetical protein
LSKRGASHEQGAIIYATKENEFRASSPEYCTPFWYALKAAFAGYSLVKKKNQWVITHNSLAITLSRYNDLEIELFGKKNEWDFTNQKIHSERLHTQGTEKRDFIVCRWQTDLPRFHFRILIDFFIEISTKLTITIHNHQFELANTQEEIVWLVKNQNKFEDSFPSARVDMSSQ